MLKSFLTVAKYLADKDEVDALKKFIDIVHREVCDGGMGEPVAILIRSTQIGRKSDLSPTPKEPPMDSTQLTADQYTDLSFELQDAEGNSVGAFDTSTRPVTVKSSDENVATVELLPGGGARVFAHKKGAAVITVEGDGKQGDGEKVLFGTHGIAVDAGDVAFVGIVSGGPRPKSDLAPAPTDPQPAEPAPAEGEAPATGDQPV